LIAIRHLLAAALSVAGLAGFAGLAPPIGEASAQNVAPAIAAKPGALPEIALGSAKAPVTVVEYGSITCPHCAAFGQNVLPMLKSKYIDTGKVRFVFREFPLDFAALAASMLARCIAKEDAEKYLGVVDLLFKQQDQLTARALDTLQLVGKQAGLDPPAVEACVKDQAMLDKLTTDQDYAIKTLNVDATPTFFVNGEKLKGSMSFEELETKLKPLLKP
jgi:protein-disulfide isomerase